MTKTTAIIATAGKGKRFGNEKKNYIALSGKPVVARTIEAFNDCPLIDNIIVVVSAGDIEACQTEIVDKYNLQKVTKIIEGGQERQDSVKKGFDAIASDSTIVLIHDGGRPLVTNKIIEDTVGEAEKSGAVITAVPVKDTIKEVANNKVIRTVPRDSLMSVQTPQGFKVEILKEAYEKSSNNRATDESMIVEEAGFTVCLVAGSYENIKITTPEDLLFAEEILNKRGEV